MSDLTADFVGILFMVICLLISHIQRLNDEIKLQNRVLSGLPMFDENEKPTPYVPDEF
jgi:hypothetical protein